MVKKPLNYYLTGVFIVYFIIVSLIIESVPKLDLQQIMSYQYLVPGRQNYVHFTIYFIGHEYYQTFI